MAQTVGKCADSNLSLATTNYPPEEWQITWQLVRLIATATTWQNAKEASDALFTVQRMAASLRSERNQGLSAALASNAQSFDRQANAQWMKA